MAHSTITFLVLGGAVGLFLANRVPVPVVAVLASLALWATGVIELEAALAGFGDPTVVFIAGTFVVAGALEETGVTTWVGQQLLDRSGAGRRRLLALVMAVCAVVAALITPNAAVATLIPAVVLVAVRSGQAPSQLLLPLTFAAQGGALLAFTGSPVNVLVADALAKSGQARVGFFEYALAGLRWWRAPWPSPSWPATVCCRCDPPATPRATSGTWPPPSSGTTSWPTATSRCSTGTAAWPRW